jgi:hypothetical protein
MRSRIFLGLLVAVVSAAGTLPAAATAGEPKIDPANGAFPVPLVAAGGTLELRYSGVKITCTNYKASGKFTSATTGNIETSFENCTIPGPENVSCNTVGLPSGTITFSESVFHLVYLTDSKLVPGVLITPPASGVFASSSCTGEIKGTGYMGRLESPGCGGKSSSFAFTYELDAEGRQKYRQITGTGSSYNLLASTFELALLSTNTWTLQQQATLTCV